MLHFTTPDFWKRYRALPAEIRRAARQSYKSLRTDPRHPSLHLKRIGPLWSVRVTGQYRALGYERQEGILWFWIGSHAEYDALIGKRTAG